MKKMIALAMAAILSLSALSGCSDPAAGTTAAADGGTTAAAAAPEGKLTPSTTENITVRMGTSATTSNNYVIFTGIGSLISNAFENYNMSAEISDGSAETVRMMAGGDWNMGILTTYAEYMGYHGQEVYSDVTPETFNFIMGGYPLACHLIVPEDSDIQSFEDIKGKTVGVTMGNVDPDFKIALEAYGMSLEDVNIKELSAGDVSTGLSDETLDAGFMIYGLPGAPISELAVTKGIKLVGLSDEAVSAIHEKYPYYSAITIPSGTYEGVDQDTDTYGSYMAVCGRTDLSEDFVYDYVKYVCEHTEELKTIHAIAPEFCKENANIGACIPVHPGAAKYFDEVGIEYEK